MIRFEYAGVGERMLALNADRIQATTALVAATKRLHERHGWTRSAREIVDDLDCTHWAMPAVGLEYCEAAAAAENEGRNPEHVDAMVCAELEGQPWAAT